MIFSFFSFFLFIAVMPLVLAPETMSEQTLKSNELKNYLEKAKKHVEKIQKKKEEQQPKQEDARRPRKPELPKKSLMNTRKHANWRKNTIKHPAIYV